MEFVPPVLSTQITTCRKNDQSSDFKNMEKPIVFLSHASKDKGQLSVLKKLLDKRAAGLLQFFLSSDGHSIPLGRNWVVRVSDALKNAKLMFVFLSPESVDSKWVHFEAGYAYANGIKVVPVCLPGMDLNRVYPPLNLLQGFNLHSHDSMGNLARTCNDVFKSQMEEVFTADDFKSVFKKYKSQEQGFFGEWIWAINDIHIGTQLRKHEWDGFSPFPELEKICKSEGLDVASHKPDPTTGNHRSIEIELPGCSIWSAITTVGIDHQQKRTVSEAIHCTLSPELFHLNSSLLDKWRAQIPSIFAFDITLSFNPGIGCETRMHKLTTKLYQSGIKYLGGGEFSFDSLKFSLSPNTGATISFKGVEKISEIPVRDLLKMLFEIGVLRQVDASDQPPDLLSHFNLYK
jgi:hypothetical protein